jgi:hypothetical protein
MLHFGAYETSWECDEGKWCECTIGQMTYQTDEESEYMEVPASRYHKEARMISKQNRYLFHDLAYWRELVEEYTSRVLSYPSDRLTAISGLAARFQTGWPDATYMTGIWREDPASLAWHVDYFPSRKSKSRIEKCPSWSWGSIETPVHFQQYPLKEEHITIISWNKEQGILEVRAPLLEFSSKSIAEEKRSMRILPHELKEMLPDIDMSWAEGENYYLLAAGTHKEGTPCLVLRAIEGRPGAYERVGYYRASVYTKETLIWGESFINTTIELL